MINIKITQCKGEGQGSCKMCSDNASGIGIGCVFSMR